jgi:hypothetical protein
VCIGVFLASEISPKRKIKNNFFWEKKQSWRFSLARSEKIKSLNCQIWTLHFHCVAKKHRQMIKDLYIFGL